jgi:hypothetical protein
MNPFTNKGSEKLAKFLRELWNNEYDDKVMVQIPQIVREALAQVSSDMPTAFNSDCLYVQVPINGGIEIAELGFGFHDGQWLLYSCTENLPEGWWETIQLYLMKHQSDCGD